MGVAAPPSFFSTRDSLTELDKELSGGNWIVFFSVFADPGIMSLFVSVAVGMSLVV